MIPEQNVREYAYDLSYKIACEKLASLKDIEKQCQNSGTRYVEIEKSVVIDYLNETYRISVADGNIYYRTSGEEAPIRDKILMLHYFLQAKGTPLANSPITYKELHDGINYYPTFFKRSIEVFINNFGKKPELLPEIAARLGGFKSDYGDIAVTINAFKYVPITIVLWHGDKEFPPEGNIMFDSTISDYLPTEDITVLCEVIAWKMIRSLKERGDNPGSRYSH